MNSQHFNWAIFQKDLTWFLCLCYFSSTPAYFWSPIPCIMKKCSGAGMRTPAFSFWYRCYCVCNKRVRKLKLRCKKLESLYSSRSLESCHLSQWQKEPTESTLYSGYLRWNVMSHSKVQGEEAKTILRVILDVESSSKNWSTEEQPHITTSPFTRQGHLTPKQCLPDDHGLTCFYMDKEWEEMLGSRLLLLFRLVRSERKASLHVSGLVKSLSPKDACLNTGTFKPGIYLVSIASAPHLPREGNSMHASFRQGIAVSWKTAPISPEPTPKNMCCSL